MLHELTMIWVKAPFARGIQHGVTHNHAVDSPPNELATLSNARLAEQSNKGGVAPATVFPMTEESRP